MHSIQLATQQYNILYPNTIPVYCFKFECLAEADLSRLRCPPRHAARPRVFFFLAKFHQNFENFAFFAEVQNFLYRSKFSVKFIFCFETTLNQNKMTHHIS